MSGSDPFTIILSLLAVGAGTIVIFAYLIFIWWLDRYEREPFWLVLMTFAWGAIGGTCFGCALSAIPAVALTDLLGPETGGIISTVVVAPVTEEFTKALVFLALMLTNHIDNETDGLIYGAATGLGFATLENLLYYAGAADAEALLGLIVIRTLFTALVHCISSALIGMAVGYARHRSKLKWPIFLTIGYIFAVICHGTWNGLATISGFGGEAGPFFLLIGCGLVILASGMMFILTQYSLNKEHKFIYEYLAKEVALGTIPEAHAKVIPYWMKRRGSSWLPSHVDKEAYVKAATLLAFRQHQMEIASDSARQKYMEEIAALRAEVRRHLGGVA